MLDVQSYLNHQHLRKLFNKTHTLTQLNHTLHPTIPQYITDFCQVANFTENKIVIGCKNASLMMEAKRYEMHFLNLCQKLLPQCFDIEWKIMPSIAPYQATNKVKRQLSQKARDNLTMAAQTIRHENLKQSLKQLANAGIEKS